MTCHPLSTNPVNTHHHLHTRKPLPDADDMDFEGFLRLLHMDAGEASDALHLYDARMPADLTPDLDPTVHNNGSFGCALPDEQPALHDALTRFGGRMACGWGRARG